MAGKPACIGVLNAIATGEARGAELFEAWLEHCTDADVRAVLQTVAVREREHAAAFAKRLCELGFGVRPRPDAAHARRLKIASSTRSDRAKFERLGLHDPQAAADLGALFEDVTLDPATGALLGRFIAEERDSVRRLCARHAALVANRRRKRERSAVAPAGDPPAATAGDLLARLDAIAAAVEALGARHARPHASGAVPMAAD